MELRRIEVDHNFREHIRFSDASFPVDVWTDEYSMFVDGTMNCHWHHEFEYGVMLAGEVDYYINDRHILLKEGDCVFINSNSMHMAKQRASGGNAVMFTIVFPFSLLTESINSTVYAKYFQPLTDKSLPGFKVSYDVGPGREIVRALRGVYGLDNSAFGFELRCLGLMCHAWHETVSYMAEAGTSLFERSFSGRHEERVKRILSYIHEHYSENLTVDGIAKNASINRSECFRCFKRITNKKPMEYINEYRLAQAARCLSETAHTVAQISSACGFCSSSYFGKLFKEKFGISPLRFRQDSKNRAERDKNAETKKKFLASNFQYAED